MKALFLSMTLALTTVTLFTACERNDYQHPLHRTNK